MKKSMIAAAVVATAFAASANAGYFTVTSANYTPVGQSGSTNFPSPFSLAAGTDAAAGGQSASLTGTSGNIYTTLNTTAISNAVLGVSPTAGNLYYFGWEDSGLGYFGVAFVGTASQQVQFSFNNANNSTLGVHTSNGPSTGANYSSFNNGTFQYSHQFATTGEVFMMVFAGMTDGTTVGGNGSVFDGNFNINYLSFNGANWVATQSAAGVSASSLNTALYAVPVPAPALLAGAGLVGAAALRRRMSKKA